jgi:hypothetical protein
VRDDLGKELHLGWHGEIYVHELEGLEPNERRVVVDHAERVFEIWRTGTWEGEENVERYWRTDVLVLEKAGNVGIADLEGACQEVPALGNLGRR